MAVKAEFARGTPFKDLTGRHNPALLTEIRRQKENWQRQASLHLARQAPAPSVHVLIFGEQGHDLAADELRAARFTPRPDPCEGLAQRLRQPPAKS